MKKTNSNYSFRGFPFCSRFNSMANKVKMTLYLIKGGKCTHCSQPPLPHSPQNGSAVEKGLDFSSFTASSEWLELSLMRARIHSKLLATHCCCCCCCCHYKVPTWPADSQIRFDRRGHSIWCSGNGTKLTLNEEFLLFPFCTFSEFLHCQESFVELNTLET